LGTSENREWLPVVDEAGQVIGKARRGDCHFHPHEKILHPVVHLHVFNSKGELFLQHRAVSKKVQPGKWDTAVGGHVSYGEDPERSLLREAREEIGISDFRPVLIQKYIWETDIEKELVYTFVCETNEELTPDQEEISDGRFWSFKEIRENIGKGVFTPNFEKEFIFLSGEERRFGIF